MAIFTFYLQYEKRNAAFKFWDIQVPAGLWDPQFWRVWGYISWHLTCKYIRDILHNMINITSVSQGWTIQTDLVPIGQHILIFLKSENMVQNQWQAKISLMYLHVKCDENSLKPSKIECPRVLPGLVSPGLNLPQTNIRWVYFNSFLL